jgi:hypothetical protein
MIWPNHLALLKPPQQEALGLLRAANNDAFILLAGLISFLKLLSLLTIVAKSA